MTDNDSLSPAEMLEIAEKQQRSIRHQIASFVPMLVVVWGVAWFFGFGALWLVDGLRPGFWIPLPVAVVAVIVCFAIAIALSAIGGVRSGRGIKGSAADAFTGVVYGSTWTIGSIAIVVFAMGLLANGITTQLASVFIPIAYALFAGIMFILSGAIWHAIPMAVLGVWVIVSGLVASFFGYPNHYLVLAVTGGLGFFVLAAASFVYMNRLRRSAQGVAR